MQFDIYRDQRLEKLLIVEHKKDIKTLTTELALFLEDLTFSRTLDIGFSKLPTGIKQEEVIDAIKEHGYFAALYKSTLTESDEPT